MRSRFLFLVANPEAAGDCHRIRGTTNNPFWLAEDGERNPYRLAWPRG
jgi:hypothetical protein